MFSLTFVLIFLPSCAQCCVAFLTLQGLFWRMQPHFFFYFFQQTSISTRTHKKNEKLLSTSFQHCDILKCREKPQELSAFFLSRKSTVINQKSGQFIFYTRGSNKKMCTQKSDLKLLLWWTTTRVNFSFS